MLSEKKFFSFSESSTLSVDYISSYVHKFKLYFRAHRYDNTPTALNYILGLLKCAKGEANMERMEEEIESSEYRAYQQFISNSNWDCDGLQNSLAVEASELLSEQKRKNGLAKGYIIDESSHLKKGKLSVGVSRQYAGVAGKVDNCQVGVYASLVNHTSATIINQRIFLPKSWTQDSLRCKQADIPQQRRVFKTKPQLAIEMIKQDIERGVTFDWIGGDGLYGHSTELCGAIDDMGLFFVLDVHKDETVFLQEPHFEVPERKSKKGRAPENLKADAEALRLDRLQERIQPQDWKLEQIRDTTKGLLRLWVYKTDVWSWDNESMYPTKRTLIITKTTEKSPKIKYSFSNGDLDEYTHKEYAYFVCQRYWVERTFDNAKNELGMSDYQVRKWKSWQHHHSLVMLASLFLMKQQIDNKTNVPLISFRDARILVILQVFGTKEHIQQRLLQMEKRHIKRQLDIDRCHRVQFNEKQGDITS